MQQTIASSASLEGLAPAAPAPPDDASALLDSLVMMVDDQPFDLEAIRLVLEEKGFKNLLSTTASSKSIDLIRGRRPEVVLLDLMMPEVTGFQLLKALKSDPDLQDIPVLILTSMVDVETTHRALELGATDIIEKPVDPSELGLRLSIPLEGRIVAVADVFDALSSKRPYKDPMPRDKCLSIIRSGSGAHFDPRVVEAFFSRIDQISAVLSMPE